MYIVGGHTFLEGEHASSFPAAAMTFQIAIEYGGNQLVLDGRRIISRKDQGPGRESFSE